MNLFDLKLNSAKKFTVTLFALLLAFSFIPISYSYAGDSEPFPETIPNRHKTIAKNPDGTYRLSLDVEGDCIDELEVHGADIVLILDVSSSMTAAFDGGDEPENERIDTAIEASKILTEAVMGSNDEYTVDSAKTRISIVTFDKDSFLEQGFSYSKEETLKTIDKIRTGHGTNWSAGVTTGLSEMEDHSRPDAEKYYIFMTDGEPNKGKKHKGYLYHHHEDYGIDSHLAMYADYCAKKIKESNEIVPYNHFYNVICGDVGAELLEALNSELPKSSYIPGKDKVAFKKAFAQIAVEINHNYSLTDVTIGDTLSSWADMEMDGGLPKNLAFEKITNGQSTPIADGLDRFSYDPATKSISWKPVPDGQSLEHHTTYRVSFDIAPSQIAFDTAADCLNNGLEFPDLGINSAGQEAKGFFSNAMNGDQTSANVSFRIKHKIVSETGDIVEADTELLNKTFETPVMDVPVSKLVVSKVWSDGNDNHANEVVAYKVYRDGEELLIGELSNANNWIQEQLVSAGSVGHVYTVEELPVNGYTTSVSKDGIAFVDEVSIESQLQGLQETQSSVTFKNTAAYGINVYKYIQGDVGSALTGAEFTLYKNVDLNDGYFNDVDKEQIISALTTDGTGTINFANLEPGSYWLVETKVPAGYTLMNNAIQIDINRVSASETTFTATRYSDDFLPEETATMDTVNNEGVVGQISIANSKVPVLPVAGSSPIQNLALMGLGCMIASICLYTALALRRRNRMLVK